MNIAVIGGGYVGVTTSVAFAHSGHRVYLVDNNPHKLAHLSNAQLPFYEEGVKALLQTHVDSGNLTITDDLTATLHHSSIVFITVGTPSQANGQADLSFVNAVARQIGQTMQNEQTIVIKSTVPVGTGKRVKEIIAMELTRRNVDIPFEIVSNPEFLREGKALYDALYPNRIVIGYDSKKAKAVMEQLYNDTNDSILFTSINNAEMIKYASNAFLATKISFVNELARLCERVDADITVVTEGMGQDKRISPLFLQAGVGYGGSCFPKDLQALQQIGQKYGTPMTILQAVENVNHTQVNWFLDKVSQRLGSLHNKHITLLGLAFKPGTDDIRSAPSILVISQLLAQEVQVTVYDPQATSHIKKRFPTIHCATTPLEALHDAHAAILVTEWPEIVNIDWKQAKSFMKESNLFDGRNALSPHYMKQLGFHYEGVGIHG
ncbi:UDP-glucose dehydrogenase family protein [Pontibacillus litoralis]|uniref:UDP-glucose 6-dehydrogenase n=1 Tax=Pontibacillus litoralis JSM 072002 TaxID=1385512 RepID=A0A0A5G7I5_9BACI|nr:UDP-glucose/GDP-mannose dehydrogenase family protein [Pontibacillus litoralis]KGX87045.1 UDP-glucose 6-dehydrogenase [Pontibacillus litoralis JSM 072002]